MPRSQNWLALRSPLDSCSRIPRLAQDRREGQMARFRAALLAATLFISSAPAFAATISLAEALGIAYETNPELSAAQASLRESTKGWPRPIPAGGPRSTPRAPMASRKPHLGLSEPQRCIRCNGQLTICAAAVSRWAHLCRNWKAKALVRAGRAQLLQHRAIGAARCRLRPTWMLCATRRAAS